MPVRSLTAVVAATCTSLLAVCSPAFAAPVVDGHFPISNFDSNQKIVAGPDGNMWMAITAGGKDVARISAAGKVDEFELEGVAVPSGIAVGPEGKLWVTQAGGVAEFQTSDPKLTSKAFSIADVKANSPIVAGPDGQMWVASEGKVVHFHTSDPEGSAKSITVANLSPKDIDVAGELLVIADAGNKRIVTMTTAGVENEFPLLGATTTSQGVAGSPGGQIAFSKSDATEGLGLLTPPGPPTAIEMEGDPFGVALGSDGAYWFAMSAANNVQRLTADGKATPLNGFPPKFFPRQIAPGPNNTMWVTMEVPGENEFEVARISGLEPPVEPKEEAKAKPAQVPETTISKGPKKKVKTKGKKAPVTFRFSSTIAGATFECALVKKPAKKGKKAPKPTFSSCSSPRKLKLKPGKYTFSVRALNAGVADPSPATSAFRIIHVR